VPVCECVDPVLVSQIADKRFLLPHAWRDAEGHRGVGGGKPADLATRPRRQSGENARNYQVLATSSRIQKTAVTPP
jgi:hypothetical protein